LNEQGQGKLTMPTQKRQESRKTPNRRQMFQYWSYVAGLLSLFSGLTLLAFTSGWLDEQNHIPIFFVTIGLLSLLMVAIYREMFEKPMLDAKRAETIRMREQIIEVIVRRARWMAAIAAVVAFIGVTGYIQATFGHQLAQLQTAEENLKKINEYFTQIQVQKAEIDRLSHEADSLRQDTERSRLDAQNLQHSLSNQNDYFKKRVKLLDSSLAALPQASANIQRILERAAEIDRDYAEYQENQPYEVTIHYSEKDAQLANRIRSILSEKGFKIYPDERTESEMSGFTDVRGTLSYYTSEDRNKAASVKMILNNRGIRINLKEKAFEQKMAKKYVIWL
jgi:outer membrane murein-binding lipoprotein Lpp